MVTMKDVAKEAGVSIASVSYYVNNKNVSAKNAQKIEAAIKKLNYFVHTTAQDLKKAAKKTVGIIFPNISEPYYEKIINSIKNSLLYNEIEFQLELSDNDPAREQKSVMDFISKRLSGIIFYSCQTENTEFYRSMLNSHIPFVFIDRKPEGLDVNYVDSNNYKMFYDITEKLVLGGNADLAFIGGYAHFSENQNAFRGFTDAMAQHGISSAEHRNYFTASTREDGFRACVKLIERADTLPSAIVTTSIKMAEGIRYALVFNRIKIPEEVAIVAAGDCEDDIFYMDDSICKISRPAFNIGETAVEILIKNINSPIVFDKHQVSMEGYYNVSGIPEKDPVASRLHHYPETDEEITVLLIDDYGSISALQQLLIDFSAKEKIKVNIEKVLPEKEYDFIKETLSPESNIDTFLFDIPWLPHLAQSGLLLQLDGFIEKYGINPNKFVANSMEKYGLYNGHHYALPFLVSTQLLFYRKDLFANEALRRDFERKYMIPLDLPKNWLQYNTISEFFTQSMNPASPVAYGNTLSISYAEQLMCNFFPRLWAYKGALFNEKGEVALAAPTSQKAVRSLLETVRSAHPDCLTDRPEHVIDKLLKGETAMCCEFFNYVTNLIHDHDPSVSSLLGYTTIPGNTSVMAGWTFGISKFSKKAESAFKFIKWITSSDVAIPHTILGGQSPHIKAYHNYDVVSLYPWLPKALHAFTDSRKRELPDIEGFSSTSEKTIEDIVAGTLLPLIKTTLSDGIPSNHVILDALKKAELSISAHLK